MSSFTTFNVVERLNRERCVEALRTKKLGANVHYKGLYSRYIADMFEAKIKYQPKTTSPQGRLTSKGSVYALPRMSAALRSYIMPGCYDVDISNCAPRVLLHFARLYCEKNELCVEDMFPWLHLCATNRNGLIMKANEYAAKEKSMGGMVTKHTMLKAIHGSSIATKNPAMRGLHLNAINAYKSYLDIDINTKTTKDVVCDMSKFWQRFERKITETAIEYIGIESIAAIIHDGLITYNRVDMDLLNEHIAKKLNLNKGEITYRSTELGEDKLTNRTPIFEGMNFWIADESISVLGLVTFHGGNIVTQIEPGFDGIIHYIGQRPTQEVKQCIHVLTSVKWVHACHEALDVVDPRTIDPKLFPDMKTIYVEDMPKDANGIPRLHQIEFGEVPISALQSKTRQLYMIIASMGLGKTYVVKKYLAQHPDARVIVLSNRISHAECLTGDLGDLGFVSYLSNPDDIEDINRLVINYQSLHRLMASGKLRPYDVLIMDEMRSLVGEVVSSTNSAHLSTNANIFTSLMQTTQYTIAVDADMLIDPMVSKVVNLNWPQQWQRQIIKYDHVHLKRDLLLYLDECKWLEEVQHDLSNGLRVMMCYRGKTKQQTHMRAMSEYVNKKLFPKGILAFNGDSSTEHTAKFRNINHEMEGYQILCFTSKILTAADVLTKFDRIYVHAPNTVIGPTMRQVLQMTGRSRNCDDHVIRCFVSKKEPEYHYPTFEDTKRISEMKRASRHVAIRNAEAMNVIGVTNSGCIEWTDSWVMNIAIQTTMEDSEPFNLSLKRIASAKGMKIRTFQNDIDTESDDTTCITEKVAQAKAVLDDREYTSFMNAMTSCLSMSDYELNEIIEDIKKAKQTRVPYDALDALFCQNGLEGKTKTDVLNNCARTMRHANRDNIDVNNKDHLDTLVKVARSDCKLLSSIRRSIIAVEWPENRTQVETYDAYRITNNKPGLSHVIMELRELNAPYIDGLSSILDTFSSGADKRPNQPLIGRMLDNKLLNDTNWFDTRTKVRALDVYKSKLSADRIRASTSRAIINQTLGYVGMKLDRVTIGHKKDKIGYRVVLKPGAEMKNKLFQFKTKDDVSFHHTAEEAFILNTTGAKRSRDTNHLEEHQSKKTKIN